MTRARIALALGFALLSAACSGSAASETDPGAVGAGGEAASTLDRVPYAKSVESIELGDAAGYNSDQLPDIVLGPPRGKGTAAGSLHVASLGLGGEIVLGFGQQIIADGPGPDFVVFENAFWPSDDPSQVFAELGEVSVSDDGETWHTFPCDRDGPGDGTFPGCAGWSPTLIYDAEELVPLDVSLTGGDAFDLADVGLKRARFVKITDLRTLEASGINSGFDLDAVGVVNAL